MNFVVEKREIDVNINNQENKIELNIKNEPREIKLEFSNYDDTEIKEEINELKQDKQDKLISGTNIKTINNESVLGSGNIEIQGGGSDYPDLTNKPVLQHRSLSNYEELISTTINGTHPVTYYGLPDIVPLQLDESGQEVFDLTTLDYGIFCTSIGGAVDFYGNTVDVTQALIFYFDDVIIYDLTGVYYLRADGTTDTVTLKSELDDLENRMYKKPEVVTSTATLGTILLDDNTKYVRNRTTGANKITVRFPDTADIDVNWQSWIIVKGSASFTYNLYDANVDAYYTGTDCTNGVFTAQVSKIYTLSFTFDGNKYLCNVVGYSWQ